MESKIRICDSVEWEIKDKTGKVKAHGRNVDLITAYGLGMLGSLLVSSTQGSVTQAISIVIGTGTTAANVSDVNLQSLTKRKTANVTYATTVCTNDTAQFAASFSSSDGLSGSMQWTESGLDQGTTNTLCMHQVNSAQTLNWSAGDVLNLTIKVQFEQGS